MIDYKISIEKVNNGFIVTWREEIDDDTIQSYKEVFAINNNSMATEDYEEKLALKDCFHFVADYFGYHYNKYGKYNLDVKWNKEGHKVDD